MQPVTMFDAMVQHARRTFAECGRDKRETCRVLEISYHTLTKYLAGRTPKRKHGERKARPMALPYHVGLV